MSMTIEKDELTPEGKAFEKALDELKDLEVVIGYQAGQASEANGVDMVDVAMWNELGTSRSPSRPFMRDSVDKHRNEIQSFMDKTAQSVVRGMNGKEALQQIGIFHKDLIQNEIKTGSFKANAEATIKKKGSSKPLIDTGHMRQSVNFEVRGKES